MTGESHVARAILLYILAGFFLSSLDATAKLLVLRDYPVWWAIWARYFFHLLLVLPLVRAKAGPDFWRTGRPLLQFARSAMLLVATMAFFTALRYLPLAEASAISFLAPMFVIMLSGPMLGERVSGARWLAVAAGFAGILLITRPGSAAFHPATLLMVVMALANALYQILTRKLTNEPVYTTLFYTALAGAIGFTLALPFLPPQPLPGSGDALLFVALGVLAGLGHWSMITALQQAQASQLTPFTYLQMAWPLTLGWLLFGQFPDPISIAGMSVIVAAGIWLAVQERRRAQPLVAPPVD
jgi:drug/metabolite transporter (DMT)-like permease